MLCTFSSVKNSGTLEFGRCCSYSAVPLSSLPVLPPPLSPVPVLPPPRCAGLQPECSMMQMTNPLLVTMFVPFCPHLLTLWHSVSISHQHDAGDALPLQDLSVYSWLDCEPDDLYRLTTYSLREVQDSFPHPVPNYLEYWRQNGPFMQYLSPVLSALGSFSFTARPMQVCCPCMLLLGSHISVLLHHILM